MKLSIDQLKGLFADSASLKSTCTWKTADLIDECRQSCGGHGYSAYSGFGKGYADHVVQCTWEGDNNILAQNSGRITIQKVLSKKQNEGNYKFLNSASSSGITIQDKGDFTIEKLLKSIENVILRISLKCVKHIEKTNDWDSIGAEKLTLSKLYACQYMLSKWVVKLNEISNPEILKNLKSLAKVFAITNIETFGIYFLQHGVIESNVFEELKDYYKVLLSDVRNEVIGLTDSFKLSDYFINSVLGNHNGDIYHNYLNTVKSLNDNSITKAPYTGELLQMLNRAPIEVRNKGQLGADVLNKLNSDDDE